VPVIAVTANAMPEDLDRARQAGFDDYVTKPLDLTRLLDAVSALLPRA
jgi:CheY-like chemotaxis protein